MASASGGKEIRALAEQNGNDSALAPPSVELQLVHGVGSIHCIARAANEDRRLRMFWESRLEMPGATG